MTQAQDTLVARADRAVLPRPFRLFWIGQSVSFAGTQLTVVALPLVAVIVLHASPAEMGMIVAAETLPMTLGPVLIGGLVDRVDTVRCLLAADYGRLVALGLVPVLAVAGALSVPVLVAVALAVGLFTALNDIAFFSVVPNLVGRDGLVAANARLEGTRSAAAIIGPTAGGGLTQAIGAANTLLVDAATYVFSVVQLHRIRQRVRSAARHSTRQPWYAGLREVVTNPTLRLLALGSGFFNLFSAGGFVLIPLFLVGEVGIEPALYGAGLAFGGVGGLAGAAAASRLVSRAGTRRVLSGALLVCAGSEVVLVLVRTPGALAFALLAASQLAAVSGVTVYVIVNAALRQHVIPAELRGRVFGAMRFIARGLMPVGGLAFGALGGIAGLRLSIVAVAAGQILVAGVFTLRRHLLPDTVEGGIPG